MSMGLLTLQAIYTIVWAYCLFSLYREIKSSQHLLPKKRIFKLHATLLVFYFFFAVMTTIVYYLPEWTDHLGYSTCLYIFLGTLNFLSIITYTIEMGSF